jgi:hypothetical protein
MDFYFTQRAQLFYIYRSERGAFRNDRNVSCFTQRAQR